MGIAEVLLVSVVVSSSVFFLCSVLGFFGGVENLEEA